jgi:HEPN superfamily AbiU2-like protein
MTTTAPVSGIIATKEDVQAFADSCVLLRSQWVHFTTLFEGSDLKRELLQTTAPTFFGDMNRLFVEHLVLHICRLTDEAQTMGRKNLTVKFLMEHSDWSRAGDTLAKLKPISDSIHAFRKRILPARKWFIAHLDLLAVRLDQPLGAASDAEWKQFWLDIQDFLELMFRHHVDRNSHFYLNGMGGMSDADSLLTALRNAKLFEAVMSDQEIAIRTHRTA